MRRKIVFWVGMILVTSSILSLGMQGHLLSITGVSLVVGMAMAVGLLLSSTSHLRNIRKTIGASMGSGSDERDLVSFVVDLREKSDSLQQILNSIELIGEENFEGSLAQIRESGIQHMLLTTHQKIVALGTKERETNWVTSGVASIVALKHSGTNLQDYAYQVISQVVKYLGANQGRLFLLTETGSDSYFELASAYAYDKKKHLHQRINLGEGLVGQAYYDREIVYLTEIPPHYIKITSGLGEALPRCICIVPLLFEGAIHGVLEIASFQKLRQNEIEFLKKIGENIGYNLHTIAGQARTEQLLAESQSMAQEVKAQEEELRQNMEELTATQEQMTRKQREMDAVFESLSTVELNLDGQILSANSIFLGITGYTPQNLERTLYKELIPQTGNDRMQYDMMWSSILSGKSFSGEFRILNRERKEMWMVGNFTPILNQENQPYKVMIISLFTTQDKEKLLELQETVAAIKGSFPMAEINADMTFKSANDLFLTELGIRRLELKKLLPRDILLNGSYKKMEAYIQGDSSTAGSFELAIQNKNGDSKKYASTVVRISNGNQNKKGLLILTSTLN